MNTDRGAPLFDYNHATDNTYKQLRDQAHLAISRKQHLSSESQKAYQRGDKQEAHALSEQAKQAQAESDRLNQQAAEYVFRENNADSAGDEIDLHGLYVKEAEWVLQKRISECVRTGQLHLKVIVGKGLHLANGVAKIKPAVDQLCTELGLRHRVDPHNAGVIVIEFGSDAQVPLHWQPQGPLQPQYLQQTHQQTQQPQQLQVPQTGNVWVDLLLRVVCACR